MPCGDPGISSGWRSKHIFKDAIAHALHERLVAPVRQDHYAEAFVRPERERCLDPGKIAAVPGLPAGRAGY